MNQKPIAEKASNIKIGEKMSFEAHEAYNLLRANLLLSFSDEKSSHIIGVTSSLRGDGKSTTAINTAYSLATSDKKVLLIDCDMRLPTVSMNLRLPPYPGLSNFLVGQCGLDKIISKSKLIDNIHVIVAGDTPPNPSELLGSAKMKELLSELRRVYDYIILDLPPMNAVSDALVISPETDGIILVVRHNYTDNKILNKTIRQFEFAEVKVLGFILNGFSDKTNYYKKPYNKKYLKYYKKYE